MNRIALGFVLFVLVTALQAQQPVGGKQQPVPSKEESTAPNALQSQERYNNRQMTWLKAGKAVPAHVTIRDWEIHGRQKIEKFPETGALVVHLDSGRITTTIGGKQEKREPGDYWSVPAGTSMGVEVTSESAALHVVTIGKP